MQEDLTNEQTYVNKEDRTQQFHGVEKCAFLVIREDSG